VGSLAVSVGSQPMVFARIVGSQSPLFASPLLIVCGPLHLVIGTRTIAHHGVPVAKEPKTSIRASAGNAVEKNEGYFPRLLWTKISDFIVV
jgi:hypothetical protein